MCPSERKWQKRCLQNNYFHIRTYTSSNDLIVSVHILQTPCRCYIWEIDVNKQQTSFPLPLPLHTGVRDIFRSEASPFICWSMWWIQALWEQRSSSLITPGEDGKGTESPGSHWVLQGSLFFRLNYYSFSPVQLICFFGGISPAGRRIYPSPRGINRFLPSYYSYRKLVLEAWGNRCHTSW